MSASHLKLARLAAFFLIALFVFVLSVKSYAQTRGNLLIELRAEDVSAGSATWVNNGSMGGFKRLGAPKRVLIRGVTALQFDGSHDAYRGPVTNSTLEGASPRTIEVWAYNESVDSDEETLVSWGRRGHEGGSMLGFGWGKSGAYGAATHWADDLGWNGPPSPKHWHYLAYVYDGKTARLYDDAVEKNSRDLALNTASGSVISIGVPNGADGSPLFKNEYNGSQMGASLAISVVRVHSRAMSSKEISDAFDRDAAQYGASRADAEGLLAKGTKSFDAGNLTLSLMNATGTAASLSPKGSDFDFTPGDRLRGRTSEKYYHLGDATLRVRKPGAAWTSFSSASNRDILADISTPGTLASQDITLNLGEKCPLKVIREWTKENGNLILRFRLINPSNDSVEIGAFGAAMVFNNLITGRSLDETHDKCSFADPYIGGGAGYLQVTRLNGQGPALLVLPENETSFEAYRPLYDDPTSRDVTFEGFYEWMVHTKAYAQNEWKLTQPWNPATSRTLKSGQSAVYGFRFVLADGSNPSPRNQYAKEQAQKRPKDAICHQPEQVGAGIDVAAHGRRKHAGIDARRLKCHLRQRHEDD